MIKNAVGEGLDKVQWEDECRKVILMVVELDVRLNEASAVPKLGRGNCSIFFL